MSSEINKRAVGTFSSRSDVERAIEALRDENFPIDRVSVIARDGDRQSDIAGVEVKNTDNENQSADGAVTGALAGGSLGGVTGLLVGLGALVIPGIGPIVLAGAEATALATTLAGSAIGAAAGSLVGSLAGLGLPEERARFYSDRVSGGDYLLMARGSADEIERARRVLDRCNIANFGVYENAVARRETLSDRGVNNTPSPNVIIIDRRTEPVL
jgi:hypothetical protein